MEGDAGTSPLNRDRDCCSATTAGVNRPPCRTLNLRDYSHTRPNEGREHT